MLIVTTNGIPGYRIEAVLGEVMGMTVRSANLGSNIAAGIRSLGGGEMPELTKVVYESRNEVMNRMWGECVRRGGNAVVGMRFDTGELGKSFTEVCAYGTAVVATPIAEGEPGSTSQSAARAAAENPGPGGWPRMDQGAGAPMPTPDFGDGQRPQASPVPAEAGYAEPEFVEPAFAESGRPGSPEQPRRRADERLGDQRDRPQPQAAPPGYPPAEHQRRMAAERGYAGMGDGGHVSSAGEPWSPSGYGDAGGAPGGRDSGGGPGYGDAGGTPGPGDAGGVPGLDGPAGGAGHAGPAGADDAPTQSQGESRSGEQPRRPARPEEQRPNSGDSWLDLG